MNSNRRKILATITGDDAKKILEALEDYKEIGFTSITDGEKENIEKNSETIIEIYTK
jgi:hypothetical protein